jgi:hypothetical protein
MNNTNSIESSDLIIVSNNVIKTYLNLGNFYDTNDGIFQYVDDYENSDSKLEFLKKLNYCEFIYILYYWRENNVAEYSNLSFKSKELFSGIYDEDTCELSDIFFEFDWKNPLCDSDKIEWNPEYTWGICPEGNVFLLNFECKTHTLFIISNQFNDLVSMLNQIRIEIYNLFETN